MNMKQFRRQYEAIQKQADKQLTALAEQVRQEVIIPYCDKYKLGFYQGNGGYLFEDEKGNMLETDHKCDYVGQRNVPKYVIDKLEPDEGLFRWPLFSYMQNYDGRKSK